MFTLAPATFQRTITVKVPVDGGFDKQTMKVTYNAVSISETETTLSADREGVKDYVRKTVNRIDDIAGEDGQPLEWNDSLRDQLLDVPYVFTAILDGYKDAMGEARAKN